MRYHLGISTLSLMWGFCIGHLISLIFGIEPALYTPLGYLCSSAIGAAIPLFFSKRSVRPIMTLLGGVWGFIGWALWSLLIILSLQ